VQIFFLPDFENYSLKKTDFEKCLFLKKTETENFRTQKKWKKIKTKK
jgi:hypothetical protein